MKIAMKKIVYILLALGVLSGCRSKKSSRTEHREEIIREQQERKDSISQIDTHREVTTFESAQSLSYELTLEGDKDSLEVKSEKRIVKNEEGGTDYIHRISVKGGKAVLKVKEEETQQIQQAIHEELSRTERQISHTKKEAQMVKKISKDVHIDKWGGLWWVGGLLLVVLLWGGYRIVRKWI